MISQCVISIHLHKDMIMNRVTDYLTFYSKGVLFQSSFQRKWKKPLSFSWTKELGPVQALIRKIHTFLLTRVSVLSLKKEK